MLLVPLVAVAARGLTGPHPIDDAYITFRYARNLAEGVGLVYNPGEWVLGTTTPLWALVLAAGYRFGLTDLPWLATVLSALFDGASAWLLLVFARRMGWSPMGAALVGLAWAFNPMSIGFATGGMETSLFVLLALMVLSLSARRRLVTAAALAGAATLVRPEGGLLALVVVVCAWFWSRRRTWRVIAAAALPICVAGIALTLRYGSPLPHSVAAKQVAYQPAWPLENAAALLLQAGLPGWSTYLLAVLPASLGLLLAVGGLLVLVELTRRGIQRLETDSPSPIAFESHVAHGSRSVCHAHGADESLTVCHARAAAESLTVCDQQSATGSLAVGDARAAAESLSVCDQQSATESLSVGDAYCHAHRAAESLTVCDQQSATQSLAVCHAHGADEALAVGDAQAATESLTVCRAHAADESLSLCDQQSATESRTVCHAHAADEALAVADAPAAAASLTVCHAHGADEALSVCDQQSAAESLAVCHAYCHAHAADEALAVGDAPAVDEALAIWDAHGADEAPHGVRLSQLASVPQVGCNSQIAARWHEVGHSAVASPSHANTASRTASVTHGVCQPRLRPGSQISAESQSAGELPTAGAARVSWQPFAAFAALYVAFYVVAGLRGVRLFPWYLVPLAPFYLLALAAGLSAITRRAARFSVFFAGALVMWQLAAIDWHQPLLPAGEDLAREQLYLAVGQRLAETLPPDAVVAAPEVGAIGYASKLRILDTVGLISPAALPYYPLPADQVVNDNAIPARLIADRQPDAVVTLDAFARLSLLPDPTFQRDYVLEASYPTTVWQSRELLVYRRVAPPPSAPSSAESASLAPRSFESAPLASRSTGARSDAAVVAARRSEAAVPAASADLAGRPNAISQTDAPESTAP